MTRRKLHACRSRSSSGPAAISTRRSARFPRSGDDGPRLAARAARRAPGATDRPGAATLRPGHGEQPARQRAARAAGGSSTLDAASDRHRAAGQHGHPVPVGDGPDEQQHVVGLPAHARLEARGAAGGPHRPPAGGVLGRHAPSRRRPGRRARPRRRAASGRGGRPPAARRPSSRTTAASGSASGT